MVRRSFAVVLIVSLFCNAFCVPAVGYRRRRGPEDNSIVVPVTEISEDTAPIIVSTSSSTSVSVSPNDDDDDDDDDDFGTPSQGTSSGGGGSNLFSLLNLATSLMPASGSGGNTNSEQTESTSQPAASPLWTLKMSILRSILQFATSMMGIASSAFANSSY